MTDAPKVLRVWLFREQFMPFFRIRLEDGTTEELDPDETREWFKERGADVYKLESVLDYCWSIPKEVAVNIHDPKTPKAAFNRLTPKI